MTIETFYKEFLQSEGICTDTRRDIKGSLFFALRGENFDGNRFVPEALQLGCRLAITERKDLDGKSGVVYVPSALELLQQLAHHHRMQVSPELLALTGSNGKTTTKEMVAAILSGKFSVLATCGNLNNHIGVPLTLLSLKNEEVAVIEMGANHPGEIKLLAEIAAPDLGLITNVGKAHLEGFGSIEGVLGAKGELYEYLLANDRKAIIDGSDSVLVKKASETGVEPLVIGENSAIPVSVRILKQSPFLEVELKVDGAIHHLSTRLVGAYNLQNILYAAAVGYQFGIMTDFIAEAIRSYTPENQRSQFVDGKRNRVILDSYNANPTSMRVAIGGLLEYASPPTMLILGDMAEMGEFSMKEHSELVRWIGTTSIDRVLLVGPIFYNVSEPTSRMDVFRDTVELESYLGSEQPEGYHILVKGSRIMGLEKLTPYLVE
ncbi:MAG: UDP-N-acetylmuramoyl-tripeptide--D-alanyl-D-alanine ligase [Bacteroidales bacterium]|nr:UDP-N-acetylmuramoyl-tripeptide--D-alanyl-D-alanine ligase [Bacteroidales bacterium]